MSSYKLGMIPGSKSYVEELADFWEILVLKEEGESVSKSQLVRILAKELDEELVSGIESDDDKLSDRVEDVWTEINRRVIACGTGYPFQPEGNQLILLPKLTIQQRIYLFMLLATRLNMKSERVKEGVDGADLFEHLCAAVAKNFLGNDAQGIVFGTAASGGFETKVRKLAGQLGEGGDFRNPNPSSVTKNDDGIDIVVWRNFADGRRGKLIGFGQCKTGTTWRDAIRKLDPEQFCRNWFTEPFVIDPIPMVFLCDTMNIDFNFITDQMGFLVLNRFRITENATMPLEKSTIKELNNWLEEALKAL